MNKMRMISTALVIFVWLVTAAFQPLPISPAAVDAPDPFTKLAPANGSTNLLISGVTLQWTASSPGVTYEYCLKTSSNLKCPGPKWISAGSATSVPIQGLTPGVTYYWQVRATDSTGTTEADSGAWFWFTTQSSANLPGAFSKLTPADTSLNMPVTGLDLTWGDSAGADRYEYCYDTVNNNLCDGTWTNTGTTTSATLSGLIYDKVYYWQVRAVNAYGSVQADGGTWWTFWTVAAPLGAFSKLSPADGTTDQPTSLTLSWQASAGATYQYCLDAAFGSTCASDGAWISTSDTSASLTGLAYNATYFWQVRAINDTTVTQANDGLFWSFTTQIAPPAVFGKTSPGDGALDLPLAPILTWEASAGTGVTYEYCYSTAKTAENTCDGTWYPAGAATSASLSGLSNETLYYWQVRAVNASGYTYANGSADALWSFTTQISAPWAFNKVSPISGTSGVPLNISLEWSTSAGAARYFYCVDDVNNDTCDSGWVLNNANTTVMPPSLVTGHTYYWQVYAENSQGQTLADGGAWWSFSTIDSMPSSFSKISPMNGAVNQQTSPWLYWSPSEGVEEYRYCLATAAPVDPEACDTGWQPISPQAAGPYPSINLPGPLYYDTTYYWQVAAANSGGTVYANGADWWTFTTIKAPPEVSDQAFQTNEDTTLAGAHLTVISANYTPLTYTLVGSLPAGTLDFHSDGAFSYTPVADFNGQVSFQFIVSDGYNPPTPPHTATITVNPVNDAPVLQAIPNLSVVSTNLATFTAVATDADTPYGDTLTYSILEVLPQGATFNPATGVFRWFPKWLPAPATNVYTFTVVVTDTDLPTPNFAQQVVQITVLPLVLWLPTITR
jgi:hypothetical protein